MFFLPKPKKTWEEGKIVFDLSLGSFSLLVTKRQKTGLTKEDIVK